MRAAVDSATAAAEQNGWHAVGTADTEFDRAIFDGCFSVHISAMSETFLAELRLAFLQLPDPELLHRPYLARNRGLLHLIEARDEAAAFARAGRLPDLFRNRCA